MRVTMAERATQASHQWATKNCVKSTESIFFTALAVEMKHKAANHAVYQTTERMDLVLVFCERRSALSDSSQQLLSLDEVTWCVTTLEALQLSGKAL
jgi:hypothetical protein